MTHTLDCRVRHADVLEWVWFLNAHAELLYKHMLGDKDTFEIAFVLAGKEALYNRNPLGPGLPLSRLQTAVFHDKFLRRTFGQEVSDVKEGFPASAASVTPRCLCFTCGII